MGSNDGKGVCLVPDDVACWGLPTGSAAGLVSLAFNVGAILPSLLLVTQLVSYHTSLLLLRWMFVCSTQVRCKVVSITGSHELLLQVLPGCLVSSTEGCPR